MTDLKEFQLRALDALINSLTVMEGKISNAVPTLFDFLFFGLFSQRMEAELKTFSWMKRNLVSLRLWAGEDWAVMSFKCSLIKNAKIPRFL